MGVIKRVLEAGPRLWIAGCIASLGIAAYATALAINGRDRAPSETAIRLLNTYRERPAVADEDNAFIYLVGFGAGRAEDPRTIGPRRELPDHRQGWHPQIKQFLEACGPRGADCEDLFMASGAVYERWIASERWLLERYETLIAHAAWQETIPGDMSTPLPSYGLVSDAQRLLLLHANALAHRGELAAVTKLLDDDARFWREVLESSDLVLTKVMATAALKRHLKWGNLVLRELALSGATVQAPAQWEAAITDAERSMRRCVIGEWIFVTETTRSITDSWDSDETQAWQRLFAWASPLRYQPQDTANRLAPIYQVQAELLDAPIADYESALRHASAVTERLQRDASRFDRAYNAIGKRTIATGSFDFGPYARRVNDIEGVRRAALTAVRLRARGVQASDVATALASAPLRTPYNNQPFAWDAGRGAIVFIGLESGERGQHRIRY